MVNLALIIFMDHCYSNHSFSVDTKIVVSMKCLPVIIGKQVMVNFQCNRLP